MAQMTHNDDVSSAAQITCDVNIAPVPAVSPSNAELAQEILESFRPLYSGGELTAKVAKIIGCEVSSDWEVCDTHENLALVHYTRLADPDVYGDLRGTVVDLETETIIGRGFGYTRTAVSDNIVSDNGVITITDDNGVNHTFNNDDTLSIKPIYEGVVIRVIWHHGKAYRMTHKKLIPMKSHWGDSPMFLDMYTEAGGPSDEELFDTTKPFSNTCFVFIVSHPSLVVAARKYEERPYIVWLGQFSYDPQRPADQVAPGRPQFTVSQIQDNVIEFENDKSYVYVPSSMTVDRANEFLHSGYFPQFADVEAADPRLLNGEGVIIYSMVDGNITDIIKVHSTSYNWRVEMRGNNPNINNQFFCMLEKAYRMRNQQDLENFKKNLVTFATTTESEDDDELLSSRVLLDPSIEEYRDLDDRIYTLWLNYIHSLPPPQRPQAQYLLSDFFRDRAAVIQWICGIAKHHQNVTATNFPDRVKNIIEVSRKSAKDRTNTGNNVTKKGIVLRPHILIEQNVRSLINNERGPSLYKLVREMKRCASSVKSMPPTKAELRKAELANATA